MELVSAVFNDIEVHFMRGLARVFTGHELYAEYVLGPGERDRIWTRHRPDGRTRIAVWSDVWSDFTGLLRRMPPDVYSAILYCFDWQMHKTGTPEELHAAALALIKAIDAALQPAPVAKPDGESVRAVQPAPDANCVTRPDGECVSERPCMHSAPASPPCPGCGKPTRECLERPPKYAGCAAWRAPAPEGAKVEHTASRLDGVVGFQLRPPPQELVVLVDDQSEPP